MNNDFKDFGDLSDMYNYFFNYETNPNYDKNLDLNYNLKISEKDKGTEKEIKVKQEVLVCQKNCKKCRSLTDKVFNLFENNCGSLEEKNKILKINIPREITDGQSLALIGEGKKSNNKFGNLIVTVKIK